MKPSYEELKKELQTVREERDRLALLTKNKIKQNQRFLQKAQEIGQIGTWELNIAKDKLLWTDETYKIFGIPIGTELTYEVFMNCIHPEDRQRVADEWNAAMNGKPYDIEHRLLVHGKTKWIREKAEFYCNEEGVPVIVTGVAQDITQKKQVEDALLKSEKKFRLVFHTSPDSINLNRLSDGMYLDINQGFTKIMGYGFEDVIGKTSLDLNIWKNPEDRKRLVEGLNKKGYVENLEAEFIGKDGRIKDGLMSARIITINDEKIIISITRDITDRKRSQLERQTHSRNLEAIFDNAPFILAICDKDLCVQMINRKGAGLVKKPKEDLSGKLCGEVFHCQHSFVGKGCGENLQCRNCELRNSVLSTFETRESYAEIETQMRLIIDGIETVLDFSISTQLLLFNDEERVLLSMSDITARKANENKLIAQKQEIESVFRSAPVGIGVRSGSVLIKVNSELEKITGYSSNELIGKNARILYASDEEYEYVVAEKYRQVSLYGTGTVETRWRRKDGKILDILMSSTPINLEDYSKGVTFSALDITESKMNAQALLDSEEKYRTMMETQEDPTYIASSDMRIEYMNPAMIEWVGEDAYGKKCHEAIWQRQTKCPWCLFDKVMKGDTVTMEVMSPISEEIYHVSSAPIRHPDGSVSKFTSYRDITEIRKLSARLQQAQKMEAIGNLAGGIAHDFNNILFPIIGMSEMLIEDFPPDSIEHQNAQEIYKAGIRGSELVKQILAFSRQNEDKLSPTRLQFVMKEVFKLIRASIPSNIEINQSFQHDCGLILADSTQLHQIGMNLITNAYHAIQEKGGKIDVDVREIEVKSGVNDVDLPPGRYATLTVADNGVGIHQENIGKIFEPYFTTKEKGKGTGLGLSVVYGIVKKYNGDIKVMSEPGRGTSFQIYLPVLNASDTEKTNEVSLPQPTGNEKILFVDDEAPIANLQKQILKKLGYSVSVRTSSIEALEAFKTTPEAYDLVISDMSMPQMTGDQLAVEILKIRPDIPIIICTGFSERIGEKEALEMGIKGFLTKPVIKANLAKEVRRVLDGDN